MTAPVDIAAAVELARDWTGQWADELPSVVEPNFNLDPDETATQLAHALIALADERRDIEQRTTEAIAAALDGRVKFGIKRLDASTGKWRYDTVAEFVRSGAWRTP